jgi:AbiV family abortive infection protein
MKDEKALQQYYGTLTPGQVADGMNFARRNASRLLADAKLLFASSHLPGALLLAILSIEESGKTNILRSIAITQDARELKTLWKEYRSHTKKNVFGLMPELVRKGARKLEDFQPIFDPTLKHPQQIEKLKQLATYTDCYMDGIWSEPILVVEKETVEYMIGTAEILLSTHEVTTREVELWITHVGPVWKHDMETMKKAVADWYAIMQSEGLFDDEKGDINAFLWPAPAVENEAKEDDV